MRRKTTTPAIFFSAHEIGLKSGDEITDDHESRLAMTSGKDRSPESPLMNERERKMRLK